MKLDSLKFALAATITIELWYVICMIAVIIAPDMTIWLFSMMTHLIDTDGMLQNTGITLISGIIGFLEVTMYAFITTYTFASIYNRLTNNSL